MHTKKVQFTVSKCVQIQYRVIAQSCVGGGEAGMLEVKISDIHIILNTPLQKTKCEELSI